MPEQLRPTENTQKLKKHHKHPKKDKYSMFSDKLEYYYSDQRYKRREAHIHFMADVFALGEITPNLSYNGVALFLLISDMKYFELNVLYDRTGWGSSRIAETVKELMRCGYVEAKTPHNEFAIHKNKVVRTKNKYHTTVKYDKTYNKIVSRRNEILEDFKEVTGLEG